MGDEMDMVLEVDMGTESEQKAPDLDTDSLSEAEYMEILGLEGMGAGGETTVEEAEEETQESDKSAAFTEHQRKRVGSRVKKSRKEWIQNSRGMQQRAERNGIRKVKLPEIGLLTVGRQ